MRIALGSDHAGFGLKEALKQLLVEPTLDVEDFGAPSDASVDYPDFAAPVARAVASGRCDRGILICGTGIGMAMAANKVPGVRAAVAGDLDSARLSREHNDANVLALGARSTTSDLACAIVRAFLETAFAGGRHERRVHKIADLDRAMVRRVGDGADEPLHPEAPS